MCRGVHVPPRRRQPRGAQIIRPQVVTIALALAVAGSTALAGAALAQQTSTLPSGTIALTALPSANGSTHELEMVGDTIWISQMNADRVLRVTVRSGAVSNVQQFALPAGSMPHGVVALSPDQAWFTLEGADRLIRINRHGAIVQRVTLPPGTGPHGLLLARNGALWFTGKHGNVVGRVNPTTSRITKMIPLPDGSLPIYLGEGTDGAIWWTELTGSEVGRYKNGKTARVLLPESDAGTASARPIAIEADSRGGIWFSEEAGNAVGRIPPVVAQGPSDGIVQSAVQTFPMPNPGSKPAGLTIDTKGAVWVQTQLPYGLVRVKGSAITQYGLPQFPTGDAGPTSIPHRIHVTADGSFWYTELARDGLGHFMPRGPNATPPGDGPPMATKTPHGVRAR